MLVSVRLSLTISNRDICNHELTSPCRCESRRGPRKLVLITDEHGNDRSPARRYINNIICDGDQTIDLPGIFSRLSSLKEEERTFDSLRLSNTAIEELVMNVTGSAKFKTIEIDTPNLKRIHSDAFVGTALNLDKLIFEKSIKKYNGSEEQPFNFFDLLRKLVKLTKLEINSPIFNVIPSNAIPKGSQLSHIEIDFHFDNRKDHSTDFELRIEDDAFFYLSSERSPEIDVRNAGVSNIKPKTLNIQPPKDNNSLLTVDLSDNKLKRFSDLKLPKFPFETTLRLKNNLFQCLFEEVFKPFLDQNENNKLEVEGTPIDCVNLKKQNDWWLNDDQYKDRIGQDSC